MATTMSRLPPPVIAAASLLEYAAIDSSIVFTGQLSFYVGGKLLGPVPRLAICQDLSDRNILLFHCDRKWNVLGVSGNGTVAEVKDAAERGYLGLSGKWIASPYSGDQAAKYMDKQWGALRCSFCRKWPWEMEKLFSGPNIGICDTCVRSFHLAVEKKR